MVVLIGALGLVRPSHAAEFACAPGDVACLIDAMNEANANGEENTITLAEGTYTLMAVDNTTDGPNGLPSVTVRLTIRGAGADTTILERTADAPLFRLLHVAMTGELTLDGLTLRGGNVIGLSDGGGIRNRGTLTVTHSVLQAHAATNGGGIFHTTGALTITQSTVSDNVASGTGGGIWGGPLTITDSTLNGNVADSGGGIYALAPVTITSSTLSGNAASFGGGISQFLSLLTLTNSTLSGNTSGIGIYGSGIVKPPARATLRNTILAGNTGPDCSSGPQPGLVTSQGHNLIGDPTGCRISLAPGDLTGDPGLQPFPPFSTPPGQGYVPLLPTSRAIDAGDPAACLATDQLGQLRLTPCDIGAVEFAPVILTLSLNQDLLHPGDTLRIKLGISAPRSSVTADAYLGFLLPDGVTVFFVTSLEPLDGVVTRLDADPWTFASLAAAYVFPAGQGRLAALAADFVVYPLTGEESPGSYALFTLLTRPGAFADGRIDPGDLLGLTRQSFTVSP
jgi:hypothetical protein